MKKMLVIDDSIGIRESLRIIFQDSFHVETADPWQDVVSHLNGEKWNVVIIGLSGKSAREVDLVRDIATLDPSVSLVALVDSAQREYLEGSVSPYLAEVVVKPFNIFELREKVKQLQRKSALSLYVRSPLKMKHVFEQQKIYFSPTVRFNLSRVSIKTKDTSFIPIHLQGERGTGREIAAKWLHFRSPYLDRPFIKLNGPALMEETFLQSFLSKEKGSYRPKPLGTMYLEEIGGLRVEVQERLMEILNEGSVITPEGREVAVNFKVVVSSSQDLRELVYTKALKEELFYKLNIATVYLPPLRERKEEIAGIARLMLEAAAQRYTFKAREFAPEVLETLTHYFWPGNVRELESVLIRSLLYSTQERLTLEELRFGLEEVPVRQEPEEEMQRKSFVEVVKPERGKEAQEDHQPKGGEETVFKGLVNELAHEIKNPLVAIKTFTQLLAERFDDQEFREQFYRIAEENVNRIDRLVEKILGSSQFSQPSFTRVNPVSVLEQMLKKNNDYLMKKGIVLRKELREDLPFIVTDEKQLSYVFDNILSSISDMVPEGSEVLLASDTVSVPLEERARVPLFRSPDGHGVTIRFSYPSRSDPRRNGGHHSVELFLAREIMERHLGTMKTSINNEKTVITVTLPAAPSE